MNIKRMLDEIAEDRFAPPTRMDAAAAFAAGRRRRRVRRRASLAAAAVASIIGGTGVTLAVAGRPLSPASPPVASSMPAVASPATPSSPRSPAAPRTPARKPARSNPTSAAPTTLDCAAMTADVRVTLRAQGFDQKIAVTCSAGELTAVADLLSSPIRVQLIISVSRHRPREAARLACSGRPGVCEQQGSAKLARGDGLLIGARVVTGAKSSSGPPPQQLRDLVLDLDKRL
jgi:hypothetical protein